MKSGFSINDLISGHPIVALCLTLLTLGMIILVGWWLFGNLQGKTFKPTVAVVKFNDGQNEIVIERDGKVTIKTPFGTYTQQWDKEKIKRFLANLDNLDFDTLSNYVGLEYTLQLTLTDGRQVQVIFSEDMDELAEMLEQSLTTVYQDQDQDPTNMNWNTIFTNQNQNILMTPTPRPSPTATFGPGGSTQSSGGSTNPWQQNPEAEEAQSFGCTQIDQTTGKKVVISNTLCIDEEPQ